MLRLHQIKGYSIVTYLFRPPDPRRNINWAAWIDGENEEGGDFGFGKTEQEAISDLLNILES